jgi:hypothetical protein
MRTPPALLVLVSCLYCGCASDRPDHVPRKVLALRPALEDVRREFAEGYASVSFVVSVAPRWSELRSDADDGGATGRMILWSPGTIGRADTAVVTVDARSAEGVIENVFTVWLVWRDDRWEIPPELKGVKRAVEELFDRWFPATRPTTGPTR